MGDNAAPPKAPMTMTSADNILAFVKQELQQDDERQARQTAAAGDVPSAPQTGSTLDLSQKNISVLPADVVLLIKDRVERWVKHALGRSTSGRIVANTEKTRTLAQSAHLFTTRDCAVRSFAISQSAMEQTEALPRSGRTNSLCAKTNNMLMHAQVLSLSKLEILDISKNQLDGIPEDIKKMANLKFLAVAKNQIRRLPLALGEMNLVKLKFDENPIEFPPPEVLRPSNDKSLIESEKDKDMCQQVKRFMKATSLRERLRASSDEDLRYDVLLLHGVLVSSSH